MSESYLVIELNHQPVELCKLLKIANLVGGGGEAKIVISEGYVLLNGEVEYQKRKKVYHEDVIEFNGEVIQLIINEALTAAEPLTENDVENFTQSNIEHSHSTSAAKKKDKAQKKPAKQANAAAADAQENTQQRTPRKRKPISF